MDPNPTFAGKVANLVPTLPDLDAVAAISSMVAVLRPDDQLTRPFCRRILEEQREGQTYSRAEIEAMNNGDLPDVMLTCGGIECRHQWILAPREPAAK